ncbi:MAG TPA: GAF domain-containing protein, partial [candidate division Zixibacteria bacterium]|nr:GAF domain-containing protein [candidate division Zixibacteria bacterium]
MNATEELSRLQAAAERAQAGYHHEKAVALYSQALVLQEAEGLADPELEYALRGGRAHSNNMLVNNEAALADYQIMVNLADNDLADQPRLITALIKLSESKYRLGDMDKRLIDLDRALGLARELGNRGLQVDALMELVADKLEASAFDQAWEQLEEAFRLSRELGDPMRQAHILRNEIYFYRIIGRSQPFDEKYEQILASYRTSGDRYWEGRGLLTIGANSSDYGLKRDYSHQALECFRQIGDRYWQIPSLNNLTFIYGLLGLYPRAIAFGEEAIKIARATRLRPNLCYLTANAAYAYLAQGQFNTAEAYLLESAQIAQDMGWQGLEQEAYMAVGRLAFLQGDYYQANERLGECARGLEKLELADAALALAWQGAACSALGEIDQARRLTRSAADHRTAQPEAILEHPSQEIWWWRYLALIAPRLPEEGQSALSGAGPDNQDKEAWLALDQARMEMLDSIDSLSDNGLRRNYFNKIAVNRWVIHCWLVEAQARGHSLEPLTSNLTRRADLESQFQRLLDIGVRLNTRELTGDLAQFILDELVELTGAERAAVVLPDGDSKRLAAQSLPTMTNLYLQLSETGDDISAGQALLSVIEPLLDETGLKRHGLMRYTPQNAAELDQTSILCVPLVTQNQMVGWIYADLPGIYGRFTSEDHKLVNVLANQAAVAIENANWAATLEERVEQRTAELAIINKVQEALAAELDIQSIFELVGETIQEIFDAQAVLIITYENDMRNVRYWVELGELFFMKPDPLPLMHRIIMRDRETLLFNENLIEQMTALGIEPVLSPDWPRSAIYVPLVSGERAFGCVSLQNVERENAFTPSDVGLLQTLANSMSVALENARLFDETSQRAAELAIINSVQEGLAAELDIQAIYELVGEKIQAIFDAQVAFITSYDEKYEYKTTHYAWEMGERFFVPSRPLNPLHQNIVRRKEVLVFNENAGDEMSNLGAVQAPGTKYPLSAAFAPLISGERVFGVIGLQNVEREYAYSESDVRLLTTLASSMSVALESARLFDETQRLLAETEQRNAELAVINSVQQGLVAQIDFQGIIDLVGDILREVFNTGDLSIGFYNHQTDLVTVPYSYEHGLRITLPAYPLVGVAKAIFESGEPLVINEDMETVLEAIGSSINPGTDQCKSLLAVPFLLGNEVTGGIQLENHEREHAFADSDVRLLQTLANSMSVALENARLFDETTQRAAELSIINKVQEGLAAELDIQAIYRLVGDKIRDIFDAQIVTINTLDHKNQINHYVYSWENGFYNPHERPFTRLIKQFILDREPVTANEGVAELLAAGGHKIISGEMPKSFVTIPLWRGREMSGCVSLQNLDREHAFSENDVRLLSTLASSMSVALENARLFDETQRLLAETEQRNAELAVINSVQQGLVAQIDFQGIIDLVGDKLVEVFHVQDLAIRLFDRETNLVSNPYFIEHGQRLEFDPRPPSGFCKAIIDSGEPLVINEELEAKMEALGSHLLPGTDMAKSFLGVPILLGGNVTGVIQLENHVQERAFSDSDFRLLQTMASGMSVALENARLFDETNQRAAELAIINTAQEGLAAELDIQAIYDLVGDKIQQIFDAQSVLIIGFDETYETRTVPYGWEKGERFYPAPRPLIQLHKQIVQQRKSLVINENTIEQMTALGASVVPGTEAPLSAVYVPLNSGDRVSGCISLQNVDREHAFSENDVRLLTTLANSMSVALENARHFDETQRLLSETEQRNAELAIINTVQRGLVGEADFQGIIDLVGDKLREIFDTGDLQILLYDPQTNLFSVSYLYEHGQRMTHEPLPPEGIRRTILNSSKYVVVGDLAAYRAATSTKVLPGTDPAKSAMAVPILLSGEVKGLIGIENHERENAFSDSDVRLLQTLANSMSVALENARLLVETQHLLIETEQRAVELATVNRISRALTSELELSALVSLVGEQIRQAFKADIAYVALLDPHEALIRFPYTYGESFDTLLLGQG